MKGLQKYTQFLKEKKPEKSSEEVFTELKNGWKRGGFFLKKHVDLIIKEQRTTWNRKREMNPHKSLIDSAHPKSRAFDCF